MANANYTLTLSPLVDTLFKLVIGGKPASLKKKSGTVNDVDIKGGTIQLDMILGGTENAPWSIVIEVEDKDKTFETVPAAVKGKIGKKGASVTSRALALKEKTTN